MVLNFFKQDVGKDISKVGLNVEVKARKFDWKKQNQKDGGSRYRKVKYLLFLMTSIYAPVSRNAIQMIWCADKYAYARFKCETFHFDNATGTNIADAEPIFGISFLTIKGLFVPAFIWENVLLLRAWFSKKTKKIIF